MTTVTFRLLNGPGDASTRLTDMSLEIIPRINEHVVLNRKLYLVERVVHDISHAQISACVRFVDEYA